MESVYGPRAIAAFTVLACLTLAGCGGGGGSNDGAANKAGAAQTTGSSGSSSSNDGSAGDSNKTDGTGGVDVAPSSDDSGAAGQMPKSGTADTSNAGSHHGKPPPKVVGRSGGAGKGSAASPGSADPDHGSGSGGGDKPDDASASSGKRIPGDSVAKQPWYARFLAHSSTWPDRGVVSAQLISGSDREASHVPVTFGQVFRASDLPAGRGLTATVDGRAVALQVDRKASWPDGSLRHAVLSARIPHLGAGEHALLTLSKTALSDNAAQSSAPQIKLNDLLATTFDATIALERDGQRYHLSARTLLQNARDTGACKDWAQTCKQWLAGPLVSEWIVGAPLVGPNGTAAHLVGYFHVRAYADANGAIDHVRVDTVIENNWAYVKDPGNQTYDVRIQVGEHGYSRDHIRHFRQARWHEVLWWRQKPAVYVRPNGAYIQASGAVSRYADIQPTAAFLDRRPASFPPMSYGDQSPHMGATGAQAAIGPLPRWSSTYILSTDARAFAWMTANDDAAGSYAFHYRDSETGRPLQISRHPYVTLADYDHAAKAGKQAYHTDLLPKCRSRCGSPIRFDIAHHPSIGYLPYLVSGDYYYLEEMQFAASYVELWANPTYRQYAKGTLMHAQGQVRGQAWSLRSIADAAFATPDGDPMKRYFRGLMRNILAQYNQRYVDNPDRHPLHVLDDYGAVIYPLNGATRVGVGPWQADFFAWAVGHAAEQGFEGARRLSRWLSVFQVARMTGAQGHADNGYCWINAAAYKLQIRPAQYAPSYRDVDAAYRASFPRLSGLACGSQPMANQLSTRKHRYQAGEMTGYAASATGFPANLQIGLAMAVQSGIAGSARAWQIFAQRRIKPDYRNYPNFAVVPR